MIPHITDEIKDRIRLVAESQDVDFVITEIGGTVGDIESLPFLEALRQFQIEHGPERCMFVHLTLVPFLGHAGELKTKPTQHSVQELRRIGIQPDMVVCRSEEALDRDIRAKIALFANLPVDRVVSARDVDSIYKVPLYFRAEGVDDQILGHFGLETDPPDLSDWEALVKRYDAADTPVRIGMVGKYTQLDDAYLSVIEALHHGGAHHGGKIEINWVDSERLEPASMADELEGLDGILVPGGFGVRGVEGKILAARFARERGVPYLGICLGMQVAVAEFARHVAGMDGANSTEFDPETPFPVIDLLPEQKEVRDMGGTMRLGADPVKLHDGHARAGDLRRGRHLRAPPPPLRGEQPPPPPARAGGPRLLGHLARRPPGRDHRAARPPVLRRVAVPPRVQVAAAAAAAALPRLRGRRDGPRARARARGASRRCAPRRSALPQMRAPVVARDAGRARAAAGGLRPALRDTRARRGASARWPTSSRRCDRRSSVDRGRERAETGADAGNLYARIPGPEGAPTVLFCAHLDTVPLTAPIEVEEAEGRYANRYEAILGADNKAAVAAFLGVARRFAGGARRSGIEFLFTTCEELALAGAKAFDRGRLRADFGFVFDHASPIGELIVAAPTYFRIEAEFHGRAAHAGIRPEDGRSAIVAAANALDADGARPARRRDHRERGPDRGRHRGERGRRALPGRARGAQPRPRARRRVRSSGWSTR